MSIDVRKAVFNCPHCQKEVQLGIVLAVEGALSLDSNSERPKNKEERNRDAVEFWRSNLLDEDRETIDMAEKTGILKAFNEAWKGSFPAGGEPKLIGQSFLMFLHHMQPWNLAARELSMTALALRSEFGNKKVAVYQWNAICALVIDDLLAMFVPINILRRPQINKGTMKVADIGFAMDGLSNWVKTKNGYVPAEGKTFLHELQKKSPGHFANLGNL